MDTATNQTEATRLEIDDLVLIKAKRKQYLYCVERIEEGINFEHRSTSHGCMNRGMTVMNTKVYTFRPILNAKGEKSKHYKRRRLPEEWLRLNHPTHPYVVKLEDFLKQRFEEFEKYSKVFKKFYESRNNTSRTANIANRRSNSN